MTGTDEPRRKWGTSLTTLVSLQAIWIRNTILHALGTTANTRKLGNTFVYSHPTISSLAEYVSTFATSAQSNSVRARDLAVQEMEGLVEKYSSDFPPHHATFFDLPSDEGDCVILTGTTGFLGTSLLIELVMSKKVKQIYALNRKDETPSRDRQGQSLHKRHADPSILESPKVIWQDVDLQEATLGLSEEILADVCIRRARQVPSSD